MPGAIVAGVDQPHDATLNGEHRATAISGLRGKIDFKQAGHEVFAHLRLLVEPVDGPGDIRGRFAIGIPICRNRVTRRHDVSPQRQRPRQFVLDLDQGNVLGAVVADHGSGLGREAARDADPVTPLDDVCGGDQQGGGDGERRASADTAVGGLRHGVRGP
ncbi:hypothetical protein GCM10028781_26200 [Nostocoides australiense]